PPAARAGAAAGCAGDARWYAGHAAPHCRYGPPGVPDRPAGARAGSAPGRSHGRALPTWPGPPSAPGARFTDVEACLLGLVAAAFEGFELLLGLGAGQQRQGLGIADRAG